MPALDFPLLCRPTKSGWRVKEEKKDKASPEVKPLREEEDMPDGPFEAMGRIKDKVMDAALDNSDRRELGKGFIGNLFGERQYRMDRMNSEIRAQMEAMDDHRYGHAQMSYYIGGLNW